MTVDEVRDLQLIVKNQSDRQLPPSMCFTSGIKTNCEKGLFVAVF